MQQKTMTLPFGLLLGLLLLSITGARAGEQRIEYGRILLPEGEQEGFVDVPAGVLFMARGGATDGTGFRVRLFVGEIELRNWIGRFRNEDSIVPGSSWASGQPNQMVGPFRAVVQKDNGEGNGKVLFSYQLTYPSTAETSTGSSSAAEVEVPADATGDVQVVMESSEDGETWVLAGPGPYPANGSKRKFRLRVVTSK